MEAPFHALESRGNPEGKMLTLVWIKGHITPELIIALGKCTFEEKQLNDRCDEHAKLGAEMAEAERPTAEARKLYGRCDSDLKVSAKSKIMSFAVAHG